MLPDRIVEAYIMPDERQWECVGCGSDYMEDYGKCLASHGAPNHLVPMGGETVWLYDGNLRVNKCEECDGTGEGYNIYLDRPPLCSNCDGRGWTHQEGTTSE